MLEGGHACGPRSPRGAPPTIKAVSAAPRCVPLADPTGVLMPVLSLACACACPCPLWEARPRGEWLWNLETRSGNRRRSPASQSKRIPTHWQTPLACLRLCLCFRLLALALALALCGRRALAANGFGPWKPDPAIAAVAPPLRASESPPTGGPRCVCLCVCLCFRLLALVLAFVGGAPSRRKALDPGNPIRQSPP